MAEVPRPFRSSSGKHSMSPQHNIFQVEAD